MQVNQDTITGLRRELARKYAADGANPAARNIVTFGGGKGLSVLLRGLRACGFAENGKRENGNKLTAIVSVADDGGSSGALRRAYRTLAPGDIRNCLLALSDPHSPIRELFKFRFNGEIGSHSLGNLIITALSQLESDFPKGVDRASELLKVEGRVLPATLDEVALVAEFADGSRVQGESVIPTVRRPIRRVFLLPGQARALPEAEAAIDAADLVVIGPGSLYTSLIPTLLVKDLADAIAKSAAGVVLVLNLMTEPGETDSYTAGDFIAALRLHAPQVPVHAILVNSTPICESALRRYADMGSVPVRVDRPGLRVMGYNVVQAPLLAGGTKVRHDSNSLAQAVLRLANEGIR